MTSFGHKWLGLPEKGIRINTLFSFCFCVAQVLGCLVWALIADTYYQPYPSYGWVMFVAIFFWLVTVILFGMYLLRLQMKLYMIPWPIVVSTCEGWGEPESSLSFETTLAVSLVNTRGPDSRLKKA